MPYTIRYWVIALIVTWLLSASPAYATVAFLVFFVFFVFFAAFTCMKDSGTIDRK